MTSNLTYLSNVTDLPDILIRTNQNTHYIFFMMLLMLIYFLILTTFREDSHTKNVIASIVTLLMAGFFFGMGTISGLILSVVVIIAVINVALLVINR